MSAPTIAALLLDAQQAVAFAQRLGLADIDPRLALALQVASGLLEVVTPLLQQGGALYPTLPIEVDQLALALVRNQQQQLAALAG